MTVPIACAILAFGFAGYTLIESKGKGLLNWAVLMLAAALLWPLIHH